MDPNIYDQLQKKAEEFGAVAKMVNDSSKIRKGHSEEAINLINQSMEIGQILNHEIEIISKANKHLRDQDNIVLNSCIILKSNLQKQKKIIQALKKVGTLDTGTIEALEGSIRLLSGSIKKALSLIQEIIQKDNEIILMDNLIIHRKGFQRESITQLRKLAQRTLEDAQNAINGSSSNLNRGMKMVQRLQNVKTYVDEKNREEIIHLIDEANMGWNIAVNVNKSSMNQLEFAERVNLFTEKLHEDSRTIQELVITKHRLFNKNLELITELTVILSLELENYLDSRKAVEKIQYDLDLSQKTRDSLGNLLSYVAIACNDIKNLANLNFDMTDSINLNADLEKKSVDLTNMEIEYFDKIKDEVKSMTEKTKKPIEGSDKNIENGKLIEKYLKQISSSMK